MPTVTAKGTKKKKATSVEDNGVKLRAIKITKKIAERIRTLPTEGWIHINPSDGKWRVRKHGAFRASGIYEELDTAIAAAKKLTHSSPNAQIFIHDRNIDIVQTIRE